MTELMQRLRCDPRREATIEAFLSATERLLDEGVSYSDLTVSQISSHAERTRTAFYAHFTDRKQLLIILFERAAADGLQAIHSFQEAKGSSLEDQVKQAVRGLFAAFRQHATVLKAVVEAAGYDEEIAALWAQVVGRFIEGAQKRLLLERVPQDKAIALSTVLVWMTERCGYQHSVRNGIGLSEEAIIEGVSVVWLSTLRALQL